MRRIISLLIALILILVLYLLGVNYFTSKSYPMTYYNGNNYGMMTQDEIKNKMEKNEVKNLSIKEGDKSFNINVEDINYKKTFNKNYIKLNREPLAWPIEIFKKHRLPDIPFEVSYDEKLLKEILSNSSIYNSVKRVKSQDAQIIKGKEGYEVKKEVVGNEINRDLLANSIKKALDSQESIVDLAEVKPYKLPKATSESQEIKKKLAELNKWKGTKITLKVDNEIITVVDWENKRELKSSSDKDFIKYNTEIYKAIAIELGKKYNTVNKKRTFHTTLGDTVTLDPGTYGWKVDTKELIERLTNAVKRGSVKEISVPFKGFSNGGFDGEDIGNSYLEIDLSTQHMWLYKNGKMILDTPIVSGRATDTNRLTPTGVYYVLYKKTPAVLKGPDWESPVKYWMPFTDEGHGLHDADWIGSFGGNTYINSGSRGCINLPVNIAPKIFNNIASGTPVVIYKSQK